jgi:hypothetical protein
MKARPAPLESMVIIVEQSALHIRSGPVRALFPKDQFNKELPPLINHDHLHERQSYSQPRCAVC